MRKPFNPMDSTTSQIIFWSSLLFMEIFLSYQAVHNINTIDTNSDVIKETVSSSEPECISCTCSESTTEIDETVVVETTEFVFDRLYADELWQSVQSNLHLDYPPSDTPYTLNKVIVDETTTAQVECSTEIETTTEEVVIESTTEVVTEPETTLPVETTSPILQTGSAFIPYSHIPLSEDFQRSVKSLCDKYDVSYDLILAIIRTESNFQMDVLGDGGKSVGLMQIQPKWWSNFAAERNLDLYTPINNVEVGILILLRCLNSNNGDLTMALKHYNAGTPFGDNDIYPATVYKNREWVVSNGKTE